MTRRFRQMQPMTPSGDEIARVLIHRPTDYEFFIYGKPSDSVREAVKREWPFPDKSKDSKWHVRDEQGGNVTDMKLSETEGTIEIVFD